MSVIGSFPEDSRKYQFVSAHSPTEDAPQFEKDDFYDTLTSVLLRAKASCPSLVQFLMIDANARVGSVQAECFGTASSDIESHNGMLLRSTLTATGLLAVNTVWCPGYTTGLRKQD